MENMSKLQKPTDLLPCNKSLSSAIMQTVFSAARHDQLLARMQSLCDLTIPSAIRNMMSNAHVGLLYGNVLRIRMHPPVRALC